MTYNFDPDRWLESHRAALERRRDRGELDQLEFAAELQDLERRYEEMLDRLDGTYELPEPHTRR
jgi:hypothetical protein